MDGRLRRELKQVGFSERSDSHLTYPAQYNILLIEFRAFHDRLKAKMYS